MRIRPSHSESRHIGIHPVRPPRGVGNRLIVVVALIGAFGSTAHAQLPVVSLRSLSQSIFTPGEQVEVSVAQGDHTEEIRELWFSHPGIRATILRDPPLHDAIPDRPSYGNFRVDVAPETPEGRYEVRAVGRFGISNPRSILVQRQTHRVSAVGRDLENSAAITVGSLNFRQTTPQARDHYSVPVVEGKRYLVELVTHSIDSRLIPAVSLIDQKGRTIRSMIGTDQADLQMSVVMEASAALDTGTPHPVTHFIAVHDALFRGGPAYQYGLRVVEDDGSRGTRFDPNRLPQAVSALPASEDNSEFMEIGGTDDVTDLEIPAFVDSAFDSPGDRDHYVCNLQKSKPVRVEVVSDRMGQPTDVRLLIERAVTEGSDEASKKTSWQRVATGDDSYSLSDSVIRLGTADPVVRFQAPEDGRYRITLIDLDSGQSLGSSKRYRLAITAANPRWTLLAYQLYPHKDPSASKPAGTHLMRGGSMTVRVFVIRDQMSSPIEISVANLPEGLSCSPARIAANQNQTDLLISASSDAVAQTFALDIVGEIRSGEQTETKRAKYATVVWEKDGYRPAAVARLSGPLHVHVSDLDTYPLTVDPAVADPIVSKKGTKVDVPIKVNRSDLAKQNIVLRAQNLPPGVKAGELSIPADKSEMQWPLEITDGAEPGRYTLWGQGETQVKFAVNPQSTTRLIDYRDQLQSLRDDPKHADVHAQLDKAIAEADKQIEASKKQTAARDFTIYVPTSLITLEITE